MPRQKQTARKSTGGRNLNREELKKMKCGRVPVSQIPDRSDNSDSDSESSDLQIIEIEEEPVNVKNKPVPRQKQYACKRTTSKITRFTHKEVSDKSESESELSDKPDIEEDKVKSNFISECEKVFGLNCLYQILNLDKKAQTSDIKKAYYKLSLRYHPDKVTDENLKEESKIKFQCLGKIYSILSDSEKKKLYDETGLIDGEDEMFGGASKDWEEYFRNMFKKVTKDDFDKFFENYKGSSEERDDLIKLYEKHEGDMEMIMAEMISDDCIESEPRFREIINDAVKTKETKKFDRFFNETAKKAAKRKAIYEKEAKEAEEIRKEMGIDESQDSLRAMILARRKDATSNFLDNLAAKYGADEKKRKGSGKSKKTESVAKEIDEESEEDEGDEDDDSDEDEDSEDERPPVKRKTSSKRVVGKKNTAKRKVKRL